MFGGLGWPELVLILLMVLLLFGAKRLPEIARSIGMFIRAFKKGIQDAHQDPQKTPS